MAGGKAIVAVYLYTFHKIEQDTVIGKIELGAQHFIKNASFKDLCNDTGTDKVQGRQQRPIITVAKQNKHYQDQKQAIANMCDVREKRIAQRTVPLIEEQVAASLVVLR